MRIGILTFHRAYNCGAMLQAWALKTVLERMGHQVEFPICNHVGETPRWRFCEWQNREKKGLQWIRSVVGRAYVNLRSIPYHLGSIPCEGVLRDRYKSFRREFLPGGFVWGTEKKTCMRQVFFLRPQKGAVQQGFTRLVKL